MESVSRKLIICCTRYHVCEKKWNHHTAALKYLTCITFFPSPLLTFFWKMATFYHRHFFLVLFWPWHWNHRESCFGIYLSSQNIYLLRNSIELTGKVYTCTCSLYKLQNINKSLDWFIGYVMYEYEREKPAPSKTTVKTIDNMSRQVAMPDWYLYLVCAKKF